MFLQAQTPVSELTDKENASLKIEVIDALFLPHEAEVIKRIPLSMHLLVDKQVWACSSNGFLRFIMPIEWLWKCQRPRVVVRAQMIARIGG